jgi:hypothetical protein
VERVTESLRYLATLRGDPSVDQTDLDLMEQSLQARLERVLAG